VRWEIDGSRNEAPPFGSCDTSKVGRKRLAIQLAVRVQGEGFDTDDLRIGAAEVLEHPVRAPARQVPGAVHERPRLADGGRVLRSEWSRELALL
jgi:hypothetical protein